MTSVATVVGNPSRLVASALLFLGSAIAHAVWPMPPYPSFPCSPGTLNCGGANPGQFNVVDDLQIKEADRSPNSNATPNSFGECGGSRQWCTTPSFFGSISHRVVTDTGAIQFDIPYDFPNAYCQNWANPDPAEWPTPFHNTTIRVFVGGSELLQSPAVFERGRWQPIIAGNGCNTTTTYSIQLWSCFPGPIGQPPQIVSQSYDVTTSAEECDEPQTCPTCGPACSLGPGGVGLGFGDGPSGSSLGIALDKAAAEAVSGFNGAAVLPERPVPGTFAPGFTYNGNNAADGGPGQSWFFDYGQTLTPVPFASGKLRWTNEKGLVTFFTGSDAGGYSATSPGDAEGTIALVSGEYILTTPDGIRRTFAQGGRGYWKKSLDRWGNGASGNASSTSRATIVDELFGGATAGRQVLLSYDVSGRLKTVTDTNSGVTQLGHDVSGRLISICRPGEACATDPWRRYAYDGSSSRILTITDATEQVIRGYTYNATKGVDRTWIGATSYASGKERTQFTASGSVVTVKREKGDGTTVDTAYTLVSNAGLWRVSTISGACPECGDENSSRTFESGTGRVLTKTNGNGAQTTYSYDADGNITQVVEASNVPALARTTVYAYAVPGTDPLPTNWPAVVRDFWKTKTEPSGVKTSPNVVTTTRSWSGTGNLALTEQVSGYLLPSDPSTTNRSNVTTYDANGRVLSIDGPRPASDITTFAYYLSTDPLPNRNLLLRTTGPDGTKTKFEYHPLGGVSKQTREKGAPVTEADAVTEYTYNAVGRRTIERIKATPGSLEQDLVITYAYDTAGRLSSQGVTPGAPPALTQTFYVYEAGTDRLLHRTNTTAAGQSGERVTYEYDDRGNVTKETYGFFNGVGTTKEYEVNRVYDGLCRVRKQTFPTDSATTRYDYDCAGNLTGIADANHFASDASPANLVYGYDALNRLTTATRTAAVGGNDQTTYGYDRRDQLTGVTDPNGALTTYVVDDFGALRKQYTPLAGGGAPDETVYGYDEASNLTSTSQTGVRASARTYDAAGRLATVTGSGLTTITHTYDTGCLTEETTSKTFGQGRLCSITDGSGTIEYGYDRRGLVVREKHTISSRVYELTYTYDAAGRRTSVKYPNTDKVMTTYDLNSRPVDLAYLPAAGGTQSLVSKVAHQINGPIRSFRTPGNLVEARSFDTRFRRLTQRTFNTNINPMTLLMGWQYGDGRISSTAYDKESNLKAVDDVTPGISPPSNRTFSYDADRYFLTSSVGPYAASYGSQTVTWTYDKNGNRLTEVRSGVSGQRTFGYENDGAGHSNGVIASITPPGGGAVTVPHLSSGDLDQDEQGVRYSYDALGRVVEAFSASGCTPIARNVFTRDALNHRVKRQVYPCNSSTVSKTEYFVYGVDGALYYRETLDAGSNLTEREGYAYLEGEPVAVLRTVGAPTGNFFLHNDHLGRPLAMTGTDGLIKWKGEFEPFGKSLAPRVKTSGIEPGFRFPGQWEFGDSGDVQGGATGILGSINALEDNWHRTYTQRWGRYTQSDPELWTWLVFPDHYLYAAANPARFVDRIGLYYVAPNCSKPPFGTRITEAINDVCNKSKPGTKCYEALRNISAALGDPDANQLPNCFTKACSGSQPIGCDECQTDCGRIFPGIPPVIVIGPGTASSCPASRGLGFGETLFHETLHLCGFGGTEPDRPGMNAAWFRYAEKACYNWRDPKAPPIGPPR